MKKLIAIVMMFIYVGFAMQSSAAQLEEQPSKTEFIDSKSKDGMYQYKILCTTYFDENLQPASYLFILAAQNDTYKHLEDIFVICYGSADEMYNHISTMYNFSENFKEDSVKVPKDGYSLMNYKLPMFGWYTDIRNDKGVHGFKTKDFKRLKEKMEKFCQKKGITINKEPSE